MLYKTVLVSAIRPHEDNGNLFCRSSGHQKSDIKVSSGPCFPPRPLVTIHCLWLPASGGCPHRLETTSLQSLPPSSRCLLLSVSSSPLLLSYKDTCDGIVTSLRVHLGNSEGSHLKILHFVTLTKTSRVRWYLEARGISM